MIADYSTALMVIMWTGISYACSNTPDDIPRRLVIEDALESAGKQNWYSLDDLDHFSLNSQPHHVRPSLPRTCSGCGPPLPPAPGPRGNDKPRAPNSRLRQLDILYLPSLGVHACCVTAGC